MAIYRLLRQSASGPEDIQRMEEAYELALVRLGLPGGTDPLNEAVAKLIVEAAQTGEKQSERICALALSILRSTDREAC
jgi:hypothetical protein